MADQYYKTDGVVIWNRQLERLALIDKYISLIWIERATACGEFELHLRADNDAVKYLVADNIISRDFSGTWNNHYLQSGFELKDAWPEFMIIEKIVITTDVENGNYITVSGRSIESILDRRIVRGTYDFATYSVVTVTNIVGNQIAGRPFPWPIWMVNAMYYADPGFKIECDAAALPITEPTRGYNMLQFVQDACRAFGENAPGFRLLYFQGELWAYVYWGQDRRSSANGYGDVIFSPEYGNLVNSSYALDMTTEKSWAEAASTGEWWEEKFGENYYTDPVTGLELKEVFLKSDVPLKGDSGAPYDDATVKSELNKKARLELLNHRPSETFDFEIQSTGRYVYQRDYYLNDLVKVNNGYGVEISARVVEVSQIWDENGHQVVPKLEKVNK